MYLISKCRCVRVFDLNVHLLQTHVWNWVARRNIQIVTVQHPILMRILTLRMFLLFPPAVQLRRSIKINKCLYIALFLFYYTTCFGLIGHHQVYMCVCAFEEAAALPCFYASRRFAFRLCFDVQLPLFDISIEIYGGGNSKNILQVNNIQTQCKNVELIHRFCRIHFT